MQDANAGRPDKQPADADATSKETLEDLEDDEQTAELKDAPGQSQLPSPDGAQETREKSDDAGPM